MKFVETAMEKQMRLTSEWDALWKGSLSGHQFEALFEEAITELELAGLGKKSKGTTARLPAEGWPAMGRRNPEGHQDVDVRRWRGGRPARSYLGRGAQDPGGDRRDSSRRPGLAEHLCLWQWWGAGQEYRERRRNLR